MKLRVDLIGFGTVGIGLLEILKEKAHILKKENDLEIDIISISDKIKGTIVDENGIDIDSLLEVVGNGGSLKDYKGNYYNFDDKSSIEVIKETKSDLVVEITYTNIKTGEPATTHIRTAFEHKKHVVTSNKGPVALYYRELKKIADENGLLFGIEGTVLSGTPVFNLFEETLFPNRVSEINGILNGTTNYILTKMELEGVDYEEALKDAQRLGYAEADPTADVEGFDALAKVVILSNVIMGANIKPDDVEREGIVGIRKKDIEDAKNNGYRYKLIGSTKIENGEVKASVKPVKLPLSNPLSGILWAKNALTFKTDLMGDITISGAGAGKIETGFSILIDIIRISKKIRGMK